MSMEEQSVPTKELSEQPKKKKESTESSKKKTSKKRSSTSSKTKESSTKPKKVKFKEPKNAAPTNDENENKETLADSEQPDYTKMKIDNCNPVSVDDTNNGLVRVPPYEVPLLDDGLGSKKVILLNDSDTESDHNNNDVNYGLDAKRVAEVLSMLKSANHDLTDETINEIIIRLFDSKLLTKKGVMYIPSINLSNTLSKEYKGEYNKIKNSEERRTRVRTHLGILKHPDQPREATTIIVVIHGPYTELEQNRKSLYDFDKNSLQNNHWSLLVWYSKGHVAYHYDSLNNYNKNRCIEALRLFKKYTTVPEELENFLLPEFVPIQTNLYECGYYVLLFLKILADTCVGTNAVEPISDHTVSTFYQSWLESITKKNGKFRNYLLKEMESVLNILIYDNLTNR